MDNCLLLKRDICIYAFSVKMAYAEGIIMRFLYPHAELIPIQFFYINL